MEFPAKILLFGEYGILLNSPALAIPYPRFSGRLRFCDLNATSLSKRIIESNSALRRTINYLKTFQDKYIFLNLLQLEKDVKKGLFFDSTIPAGAGLGSSGALTAALYERYAMDLPLDEKFIIKTQLAAIESCFHGKSSGIDPLTSFLNDPLHLENGSNSLTIPKLANFGSQYTLFLIQTESRGETGELVAHFLKQCKTSAFKTSMEKEYVPLISKTIEAISAGDFEAFEAYLASYSQFQLNNFDKMIPVAMRRHFEYGLESGEYYLKLCGSGGGGYLLAISGQPAKAEEYFQLNHLEYSIVEIDGNRLK